MENISNGILCLKGESRNYAIEFEYVEELCQSLQITPIPALPDYYCGMGNYKGKIIPVLRLDGIQEKEITVIIKWQRYLIGLIAPAETFIATHDMVKLIESPQEADRECLWKEKGLCQVDGFLYSLIDVENTIEGLILYP